MKKVVYPKDFWILERSLEYSISSKLLNPLKKMYKVNGTFEAANFFLIIKFQQFHLLLISNEHLHFFQQFFRFDRNFSELLLELFEV